MTRDVGDSGALSPFSSVFLRDLMWSKVLGCSDSGDLWQFWHFWQFPQIYLLVNTLTPPYPLPMYPSPSHFGVGLSQPPPRKPSQPVLPPACSCFYYLINRLVSHPSGFHQGKKERRRTLNYFPPPRSISHIAFHPPHPRAPGRACRAFGHGPKS
jgi:hypothetical protein